MGLGYPGPTRKVDLRHSAHNEMVSAGDIEQDCDVLFAGDALRSGVDGAETLHLWFAVSPDGGYLRYSFP